MRKLEEIIKEIEGLDRMSILCTVNMTKEYYEKLNDKERKEIDELLEDSIEDAKEYITSKYNKLDEAKAKDLYDVYERDYEIADFKVFEEKLGIIKDEKEKEQIDNEMRTSLENFVNKLEQSED